MKKVISFEQVNEAAAGIDIGSEKIFVSPDGTIVDNFGTYTGEYHRLISYLQQRSIKRVAMEATGIYWIGLYNLLEAAGIRVSLINPKETKQKKGKKTDVRDCRWIQKLFSAGLLKESFIPEGKMLEIRYRNGKHLCKQDATLFGIDEYKTYTGHQPDTWSKRNAYDESDYIRRKKY